MNMKFIHCAVLSATALLSLGCVQIFCGRVTVRNAYYVPGCGATTALMSAPAATRLQCAFVCSVTNACEAIIYDESGEMCQLSADPIFGSASPVWKVYHMPSENLCFQGSCYWLMTERMNYEDATAYCESAGGHVVVTKSQDEYDFVRNLLGGIFKDQFVGSSYEELTTFIGARDEQGQGEFTWLDGTPVSGGFTAWYVAEPSNIDEHCVLIHRDANWLWFDISCSITISVLCEYEWQ